jgi:hypothetical protein
MYSWLPPPGGGSKNRHDSTRVQLRTLPLVSSPGGALAPCVCDCAATGAAITSNAIKADLDRRHTLPVGLVAGSVRSILRDSHEARRSADGERDKWRPQYAPPESRNRGGEGRSGSGEPPHEILAVASALSDNRRHSDNSVTKS